MTGDVAQQAELVMNLVQMAVALVDGERRDLSHQRNHRRAHAIGGQQRRRGIQQPRPGHHREGLRLPRHQRRPQCHIRRRLLMPRMNHAHAVAGPLCGIEEVIVVHAGQGIERIDAMPQQALDHSFGGSLA